VQFYGNNSLEIYYKDLPLISLNALDAFKLVSTTVSTKVPMSAKWDARRDKEMIKDMVKDYDWTYTTLYKGTGGGFEVDSREIKMELLTRQDPILYYNNLILYEGDADLIKMNWAILERGY
jgi:type 2A phosphatase activator TIP41